MIRRLQRIPLSVALFWLIALTLPVIWVLAPTPADQELRTDVILRWLFPLVVATWIISDAQRRRIALCYDYGAFVWFAWPLLAPLYLFQTRGLKALLTFACFALIGLVSALETLILSHLLDRE